MSWWRRNWRWFLAVLLSALAAVAVFIYWVVRKQKQVNELQAKLALGRAAAKVQGLEADKKARAGELVKNAEATKKVQAEIAEAKRAAVAVVKDVADMTDLEVALEFRKLGY